MPLVRSLTSVTAALLVATAAAAGGTGEHSHDNPSPTLRLETMRVMQDDHDHAHDFAAMDGIPEDDMHRNVDYLMDIGLVVPTIGAEAFVSKGCIICHAINGVGGEIGPPFDAAEMPQPMNAFEFAARMWRGAPATAQMQEDFLGEMIEIGGQELADIVAFV